MFNQNESNEETLDIKEKTYFFFQLFLDDTSLQGIRNPRIPFNFDHKLINVDAVDENFQRGKKEGSSINN